MDEIRETKKKRENTQEVILSQKPETQEEEGEEAVTTLTCSALKTL